MTILGTFLLVAGAAICLIASIGVLRLPDFFMRMHAATKAGVAGSGAMLLGVACIDTTGATWIKVLLALLFLLITTPIASHLLGRAGYVGSAPLWQGTIRDDLADELQRSDFEAHARDRRQPEDA